MTNFWISLCSEPVQPPKGIIQNLSMWPTLHFFDNVDVVFHSLYDTCKTSKCFVTSYLYYIAAALNPKYLINTK